MSFAVSTIRICQALWVFLCALLIGPAIGCTSFQTLCTNKWFDTGWLDPSGSAQPVNTMITFWENQVRITEDSVNHGAPLPGLAGRLFLFNEGAAVDANGRVVVQMLDLTHAAPGKAPDEVGTWTFPAKAMKQLKRKDPIGEGYTLFLPWDTYRPDVKVVQIQVCYIPENGSPRYSSPSRVTLQSGDFSSTIEHRQIVPAQKQQPQDPHASPAPILVPESQPLIVPRMPQPPPLSRPGR